MITQTEIINRRIRDNAPASDTEILADLIKTDMQSAEYRRAMEGDAYYSGEQNIKAENFQTSWVTRVVMDPETRKEKEVYEEFRNPNRSNVRMQHRFLYNHVEQKVSYIAGREPNISVDGAKASDTGDSGNEEWEFQNVLAKTTNATFRRLLLEWLRRASIGGKAWLHEYKDANGELRQIVVPRTEGIAIYDTIYNRDLVEFIRHYEIDVWEGKNQHKARRAEWWTDKKVTYYISDKSGNFRLDTSQQPNPAPHWTVVTSATGADGVTLEERRREPKGWGRVPFVELANNSDALTDLHPYKDLIDAYDLVASKGTNNLMDFNEFYAVVTGYGGETASSIVKMLEINRAINVNDSSGNVTMEQLDMQMGGRIDWLKELWDAIHFFGCAVDPSKDHVGAAASGVSLEFQYSLLDLKVSNMITEAELALVQHFTFVTDEYNRKNGTSYDPSKIAVQFNKNRVVNNLETVQMIIQSKGLVAEQTLLRAHPLVKDPDQAYKDILAERETKATAARDSFADFAGSAVAPR